MEELNTNHATDKSINPFIKYSLFVTFLVIVIFISCTEEIAPEPDPSDNLAIDSLVATQRTIIIWEETYITAYTRGENLTYNWKANHGIVVSKDTATVRYWACPSCQGKNIIECMVSNEYGSISDTIMIDVIEEE